MFCVIVTTQQVLHWLISLLSITTSHSKTKNVQIYFGTMCRLCRHHIKLYSIFQYIFSILSFFWIPFMFFYHLLTLGISAWNLSWYDVDLRFQFRKWNQRTSFNYPVLAGEGVHLGSDRVMSECRVDEYNWLNRNKSCNRCCDGTWGVFPKCFVRQVSNTNTRRATRVCIDSFQVVLTDLYTTEDIDQNVT